MRLKEALNTADMVSKQPFQEPNRESPEDSLLVLLGVVTATRSLSTTLLSSRLFNHVLVVDQASTFYFRLVNTPLLLSLSFSFQPAQFHNDLPITHHQPRLCRLRPGQPSHGWTVSLLFLRPGLSRHISGHGIHLHSHWQYFRRYPLLHFLQDPSAPPGTFAQSFGPSSGSSATTA